MKHHQRVSGTLRKSRYSTMVGTDSLKGGPTDPWVQKKCPVTSRSSKRGTILLLISVSPQLTNIELFAHNC